MHIYAYICIYIYFIHPHTKYLKMSQIKRFRGVLRGVRFRRVFKGVFRRMRFRGVSREVPRGFPRGVP
jgi:hypothetical protein